MRYNLAFSESNELPTAKNLGNNLITFGKTIKSCALELSKLSNVLIMDPVLPHDSQQKENTRRLIQNNMDAARYLSVQLKNFTQFCVPLDSSPPRILTVINY